MASNIYILSACDAWAGKDSMRILGVTTDETMLYAMVAAKIKTEDMEYGGFDGEEAWLCFQEDFKNEEVSFDTELASTITVLATPQQARLLAELEQTGKLHAALVYRGGAENAQKFLDEQAKLLEALYPVKSEGLTYETENNDSTQASAPDSVDGGVSANGDIPDVQD